MKRQFRKIARAFLLLVIALCLFQMGRAYRSQAEYKSQMAKIEQLKKNGDPAWNGMSKGAQVIEAPEGWDSETDLEEVAEPEGWDSEIDLEEVAEPEGWDSETDLEEAAEPVMLERYRLLYEANEDLVGWLTIKDTPIDYPVMQCEDDEFYLHHDFFGKESRYGCLYVRGSADLENGTNFIIYGHDMKDDSMFGSLDEYKDEDYCREHPLIRFDTLYEERSYEIVAVFLSRVYKYYEDAFKYYEFYEAESQEEFDDFYDNIKSLSLYDTGVTAEYGDRLLTLSTCAYHVTDGRLVVVARLIARGNQGWNDSLL